MWGKAIPPVATCCGTKLTLRFLAEAANSTLKEQALPTQILFAFTPKNKLCAWRRHGRAPSSWRGLQKGNSHVRATVNCFSIFLSVS